MILQKVCATFKKKNTSRNTPQKGGGHFLLQANSNLGFTNVKPNFSPAFYAVDD